MLSRVAERIYWLSRYMERCENTARLVNVYSTMLLDLPSHAPLGWGALIDITVGQDDLDVLPPSEDECAVVHFLLADKANPSSLINSLTYARENSRITRDVMPMDVWELINDLYLYVIEHTDAVGERRKRHALLTHVIHRVQQWVGMLEGCMSHNHAQDMICVGRFIERADMTTRIIDAALLEKHLPNENLIWVSVLRALGAYQMYCQEMRESVKAESVVSFLMQNKAFPRAVARCLMDVERCLWSLPNSELALAENMRIQQAVHEADVQTLLKEGLHDVIDQLQLSFSAVHDRIADAWFLQNAESNPEQRLCES
jgi:uncharacterized alpha-E superfamily protein